eukprot:530295-Rhodomonas_salina.4
MGENATPRSEHRCISWQQHSRRQPQSWSHARVWPGRGCYLRKHMPSKVSSLFDKLLVPPDEMSEPDIAPQTQPHATLLTLK